MIERVELGSDVTNKATDSDGGRAPSVPLPCSHRHRIPIHNGSPVPYPILAIPHLSHRVISLIDLAQPDPTKSKRKEEDPEKEKSPSDGIALLPETVNALNALVVRGRRGRRRRRIAEVKRRVHVQSVRVGSGVKTRVA